jgi:dihydrofolate synthase/folylpolyglutamate synthase
MHPLEWLFAAQNRGVQPGLEKMERLLKALGNPESTLRCLHVAGTNGKGSVCAFAESVLLASGHHTGFYSSPHLVDFSERFRIDGLPAPRQEIEEGIRRLQVACSSWPEAEMPTFFELVTAMAFDLFARAKCDIVVLETGLGGRLDATNTAPKIACAITPIALDHTEWLGETLTKIAREKAGILRSHVPVVMALQEEEAAVALQIAVKEIGSLFKWVEEPLGKDFVLGLSGSYQRRNAALALELLKAGGFYPSIEEIRQGLSTVSWPGRFQRFRDGMLILDGAHNLHAVWQLVETWNEEFCDQKCRLVFGALADKDAEAMLSVLESIAEEVSLVPVGSPRSLNPKQLAGNLQIPHRIHSTLKEALDDLFQVSSRDGKGRNAPVLLTGSLFLVGEALSLQSGAAFHPQSQ